MNQTDHAIISIRDTFRRVDFDTLEFLLRPEHSWDFREGLILGSPVHLAAPHLVFSRADEFLAAAQAFTQKAERPIRTPLTRENLLKWAEGYIEEHVTTQSCEITAKVLANILRAYNSQNLDAYGKSELVDYASDLRWNGCKGYKDYTVYEALDEIMAELTGPDSAYEFKDMEDLLEEILHIETTDLSAGEPAMYKPESKTLELSDEIDVDETAGDEAEFTDDTR